MVSGIYCIERIETGEKYIGKGKNLKREMNRSHKECPCLYNAIKKYGENSFIRYIIEYCEIEELNEKEQDYIENLNTLRPNGYNLTKGGNGQMGWIPSPETREKIRQSQLGEKGNNYGKHFSVETKEKISKANKGKRVSIETREKISKANKGREVSIETREKISKGNKGKTRSSEQRKRVSPNKGKRPSIEAREAMSISHKGKKKNISTSRFYGVCWNKNKNRWTAYLNINKKNKFVGNYITELEAAAAYDKYIIKNNFPNPLNFPKPEF